jgi:hypothetical protein
MIYFGGTISSIVCLFSFFFFFFFFFVCGRNVIKPYVSINLAKKDAMALFGKRLGIFFGFFF